MGKLTNKDKEIKQTKETKKMKKVNFETIKTVVIAILITGIVAFIGGVMYGHQADANASELVKDVKVVVQPSK